LYTFADDYLVGKKLENEATRDPLLNTTDESSVPVYQSQSKKGRSKHSITAPHESSASDSEDSSSGSEPKTKVN